MSSTSKKSNPDEIIWEVGDDSKSWWQKRSGLERKLIISFGVTIVVFIGIFIFMGLRPSEVQEKVACSTNECLTSASQIVNLIDTNIEYCDDFYHFACGKSLKETIGEDIDKEILQMLQEPISSGDHFMVKSQKALFQGCMNLDELEEESLPVIQNLIRELNEWPVVVGHRWRDKQFDWADMVVKLRKKGHNHDMLLNVGISTKDGKVIPVVHPPVVTIVEREHTQLYIKYMTDIAQLFGAEPNRTAMEMEKVFDFMEKLREIRGKFWTFDNDTRVSIADFQEEYDDIDWYKFLYNMVTPHKLSAKDLASFPNPDFMDAFSLLMTKTPQRIQATYIIWTVLEELMPFFPKAYRDIQDNYLCASGNALAGIERSETCREIVNGIFIPTPTDILYMRNHLPESKREKIADLFENVKSQTISFFEKTEWLDEPDLDHVISAFNDTTAIIGLNGDYLDDSIFEKHSMSLNKRGYGGSFLNMYLNQKKKALEVILRAQDKGETLLFDQMITYTSPYVNSKKNKIVLPIGMLSRMFYDVEGPAYLIYGALGKAIATELVHNLIFEDREFEWSNSSVTRYVEKIKCMLKDSIGDKKDDDMEEFTEDGAFANFLGIKIAYDAYQEWIKENGEEDTPVGLDYSANQLFWIAALVDECYDKKGVPYVHFQKFYEKNTPMIYNTDFLNDFECSPESKMYPSDLCDVW